MSSLTLSELDRLIPKLAKDEKELERIKHEVKSQKTLHSILVGDAQDLSPIRNESVHLVLTSPPYWNLKQYNHHKEQLGHVDDYEEFLDKLDSVWRGCFDKVGAGALLVLTEVLFAY